jgi:hypothetical protein
MSEQLNLFDVAPARQEQERRRAAYRARRDSNPDGRPLDEGESWCGRCGQTVTRWDLVCNHDCGYCGCPVEVDPTWSRYPRREDGRGWRGHGAVGYPGSGGLLTVEDLCDRWDRLHFADCACGHPWGLHEDHAWCLAWCGCDEYREVAS